MKHHAILPLLILVIVMFAASSAFADIWAISENRATVLHIYKNGKMAQNELPVPGLVRDFAATQDGAYLYFSFSNVLSANGDPNDCEGPCQEGLVVFDAKTKLNVLQMNDIPNPGRLVIDESDSILYLLSDLGIQRLDISKLPTGGRANQWTGWNDISQPLRTSGIDTREGKIAFSGEGHYVTPDGQDHRYWWLAYCGDALWVSGLNSCPMVGLPNREDGSQWPPEEFLTTDVMISPDQESVLTAISLKVPSLPTIASTYHDGGWDYQWAHDVNLAGFDVKGVPDPGSPSGVAYGLVRSWFSFGTAGIFRVANIGDRFYATTANDGILYCGDFTGATCPQLQLGSRLTGIAYGYDGRLYVSDTDGRMIYPIKLGKTPEHDRVEKGYAMPLKLNGYQFEPTILIVSPPAK